MTELYRAKWYATQQEMIADLDRHIAEQDEQITAYQTAKDNLELRLARAVLGGEKPERIDIFVAEK